jgi:tRNA A37 threonylcarbamoyladenosine dehydratase
VDKPEGVAEPVSQSDGSLNCHGYGSVVSVTATFGLCATGWVLDKISA